MAHSTLYWIYTLCGASGLYGFHGTYLAKDSLSLSSPFPPDDCFPLSVLVRAPMIGGTCKGEEGEACQLEPGGDCEQMVGGACGFDVGGVSSEQLGQVSL